MLKVEVENGMNLKEKEAKPIVTIMRVLPNALISVGRVKCTRLELSETISFPSHQKRPKVKAQMSSVQ